MKIIIADNSVLSNFARLNAVEPLKHLFGSITICSGVETEIKGCVVQYPFMGRVATEIETGWIIVKKTEELEMLRMIASLQKEFKRLSIADAASICLAYFGKTPLAIDDNEGIEAAKSCGIEVLTTLDILKMWEAKGIFKPNELNRFLDKLKTECRHVIKYRFN